MRIQNVNQGINSYTITGNSLPLESRVEAVKQKILEQGCVIEANESLILDLKGKLKAVGIPPNGFLAGSGALQESQETGELGNVENELFALQRKASCQEYFIKNMKAQLQSATSIRHDPQIDVLMHKIAVQRASVDKNSMTIQDLKSKLIGVVVFPNCPILDADITLPIGTEDVRRLEKALRFFEKKANHQERYIDAIKKQLEVEGAISSAPTEDVDSRVSALKQKIVGQRQEFHSNAEIIQDLKNQLEKAGITPHYVVENRRHRFSRETGELRVLENKSFAIEARIKVQEFHIGSMRRQLIEGLSKESSEERRIGEVAIGHHVRLGSSEN